MRRASDICSIVKMMDLRIYIEDELARSEEFLAAGVLDSAFNHLERAHVLGQARTFDHTRIH